MRKLFILLCLFALHCNKAFPIQELQDWTGIWENKKATKGPSPKIPFHTIYTPDYLIIYNENPDRDIHIEITSTNGEAIYSSEINAQDSSQIQIHTSKLPYSEEYTIILTSMNPTVTSMNPTDRIQSVFK